MVCTFRDSPPSRGDPLILCIEANLQLAGFMTTSPSISCWANLSEPFRLEEEVGLAVSQL